MGTNVPIREAVMITEIREIATVKPKSKSKLSKKTPPKTNNPAKTNPLKRLNSTSFSKRFNKDPRNEPLAKPCNTIAEDCTPTFPAIAAINGTKKNKAPCFSIASSKVSKTFTLIKPPKRARINQGKRARVSCQMLLSASTSSEIPAAIW